MLTSVLAFGALWLIGAVIGVPMRPGSVDELTAARSARIPAADAAEQQQFAWRRVTQYG